MPKKDPPVNQHKGTCSACGFVVPRHYGFLDGKNPEGKWQVIHYGCVAIKMIDRSAAKQESGQQSLFPTTEGEK